MVSLIATAVPARPNGEIESRALCPQGFDLDSMRSWGAWPTRRSQSRLRSRRPVASGFRLRACATRVIVKPAPRRSRTKGKHVYMGAESSKPTAPAPEPPPNRDWVSTEFIKESPKLPPPDRPLQK